MGPHLATTEPSGTAGLTLRPGRRERLGDQLYGQILQQIVSGALQEGDKLPSENEICRRFNVSRPTVREALMRLNADGLVVSRQGAGSFVQRRPSGHLTRLADAADVAGMLRCIEVRIGLEGQAASLAAQRRTAAQLEAIARAFAGLRESFAQGKTAAPSDLAFHVGVARASGNDLFSDLLATLRTGMEHSMAVALGITREGSKDRARRVIEEHEAIYDAIARGDANAAELAMRYHLDRSRQRITDGTQDL